MMTFTTLDTTSATTSAAAESALDSAHTYPAAGVSRRKVAVIDLVVLLTLLAFAAVAGWATRGWSVDDAYITFRYATNLKAGLGFIYNEGQTVFGTTAPFYALLLGILGRIFSVVPIPTISIVISVISLAVLSFVSYLLIKAEVSVWAGILCALFVVTNPLLINTLGMEGPFLLALVTSALLLAVRGREVAAGVLLGLAVSTRGDAVLVAGLIVAYRFWQQRRVPYRMLIALAVVGSLWAVYALQNLGSILPDTLSVKMMQGKSKLFGDSYFQGLWTTLGRMLVNAYPLVLIGVFSLWGLLWLTPKRTPLLVLVAWGALHAVAYSILNVPAYYWYYSALIPAIAVLMACGAHQFTVWAARLVRRLPPTAGWPPASVFATLFSVVSVVLLIGALVGLSDLARDPQRHAGREKAYAQLGKWFQQNSDRSQTVGAVEVGAIGYFSERPIIDFMGLITPEAAAHVANYQLGWTFGKYLPDFVIVHGEGWYLEKPFMESRAFQKLYAEVYRLESPNYELLRVFKKNKPGAMLLEAEAMFVPNEAMRNQDYVNLFADSQIWMDVDLPVGGEYEIAIVAAGSSADNESAKFEAYLNKDLVMAEFTRGDWAEYKGDVMAPAGKALLVICFTNDYNDPITGEDRNLLIDQVIISPKN